MKDSTDAKEKTSRRSFAKSVATALVAAPVLSSLSSCAHKSDIGTTSPPEYLGANPPVIIDGGSFEISIPATLKKQEPDDPIPPNPPSPPKSYKYKFKQKGNKPGPIKGIHIVDDYCRDVLKDYMLGSNETLQVQIWIAQVDNDLEDIDNASGEVKYKDPGQLPDIVIQGGKIEIRMDKDISSNERKLFRGKKNNKKRYHINDWDSGTTPFRLAQVMVYVSSKSDPVYTSTEDHLEDGLRIILYF